MITIYFNKDCKIIRDAHPGVLKTLNADELLWIDLTSPTEKEQAAVENFINMKLLTREQSEEIESTSKYKETHDTVIANTNYFIYKGKTCHNEPASFIITRDGLLVSTHHLHLESLNEAEKRISLYPLNNTNGYHLFITVLESLIDYDADMVELITRQLTHLSKDITSDNKIDKSVLHRINELQEKTMTLRENIFDLQRVLSGILRSDKFPEGVSSRLKLMIKDVDSLINHGEISFQRLDYMQDTALGLINIDQNEIVKILSVAAVIFMPPTLIASIYGMNFKVMPEVDWVWEAPNGWIIPAGYIFAIALMLLATFLTYWLFKYKKWL